MLLLVGANPYAQTASGYTPSDIAKLKPNKKMVDFLKGYMVYYKAEELGSTRIIQSKSHQNIVLN